MGNRCSICMNPKRPEIDEAIIRGDTLRTVSLQYGMSTASVQRHKNAHLPKELVIAKDAKDVAAAGNLLSELTDLKDRTERILAKCEQAGDLRTALLGIKELRNCVELLLKVSGELQPAQTVNISIHPEWVKLQAVIFQTLEEFPVAKSALIQAIGGRDDKS